MLLERLYYLYSSPDVDLFNLFDQNGVSNFYLHQIQFNSINKLPKQKTLSKNFTDDLSRSCICHTHISGKPSKPFKDQQLLKSLRFSQLQLYSQKKTTWAYLEYSIFNLNSIYGFQAKYNIANCQLENARNARKLKKKKTDLCFQKPSTFEFRRNK